MVRCDRCDKRIKPTDDWYNIDAFEQVLGFKTTLRYQEICDECYKLLFDNVNSIKSFHAAKSAEEVREFLKGF